MAEPDVYLEKLSAFSRMLRLEGLTVSPKETEDAARMLIQLGFQDREQGFSANCRVVLSGQYNISHHFPCLFHSDRIQQYELQEPILHTE